jgi:hypothetical protein
MEWWKSLIENNRFEKPCRPARIICQPPQLLHAGATEAQPGTNPVPKADSITLQCENIHLPAGYKSSGPPRAPVLGCRDGDIIAVCLINAEDETTGWFEDLNVELRRVGSVIEHKRAAQPIIGIGAAIFDLVV